MAVSFEELPHKKKGLQTNLLFGFALLICAGFSLFLYCFINYFQQVHTFVSFSTAAASLRTASGDGLVVRTNALNRFSTNYGAHSHTNNFEQGRIADCYSGKEAKFSGIGGLDYANFGQNKHQTSRSNGGHSSAKTYGARFAKVQAAFRAHDLTTAKNTIEQLKADFPDNRGFEQLDNAIEQRSSQQRQTLLFSSLTRSTRPTVGHHIDSSLKLSEANNKDASDKSNTLTNEVPHKIAVKQVSQAKVRSKYVTRIEALIAEADHKAHSPASFSQAEAIYQTLLETAPQNGDLWRKLAAVQAFQNKFRIAENSYRHALSIVPEDFDARLGLANLYIWRKKYKDAEILLRSLRTEFPDNQDIMLADAQMLRNFGDHKRAIKVLSRIIVLSPDNAEAWIMLGDCQRALLNDLAAKDAYQQAYLINPRHPNIFHRLNSDIRKRWRLDLNSGVSSLTNPYSNWGEGGIGLSYRIDERNTITGRLKVLHRFGKTDRQLQIGLIRELVPKTWGVIGINWTPRAKFSSHYEVQGSLSSIVRDSNDIVGPLTATLKAKSAWYANGNVRTIFLSARQAFFHDQLALTGVWVSVFDRRNRYHSGYIARIDGTLLRSLRAHVGYSDMLEASNSELIATKSLFSGVSVDIDNDSQLGFNWAREHRYDAFNRSLYDIALVRKF